MKQRSIAACCSGDTELDLLGRGIPVPVAERRSLGSMRSQPYVEPHGRIESGVLANQDVDEFVMESSSVFGSFEIALGQSPVANGFGDAGHEGADSGLALGRADFAVQIF